MKFGDASLVGLSTDDLVNFACQIDAFAGSSYNWKSSTVSHNTDHQTVFRDLYDLNVMHFYNLCTTASGGSHYLCHYFRP
jgi:hypothetical protein